MCPILGDEVGHDWALRLIPALPKYASSCRVASPAQAVHILDTESLGSAMKPSLMKPSIPSQTALTGRPMPVVARWRAPSRSTPARCSSVQGSDKGQTTDSGIASEITDGRPEASTLFSTAIAATLGMTDAGMDGEGIGT